MHGSQLIGKTDLEGGSPFVVPSIAYECDWIDRGHKRGNAWKTAHPVSLVKSGHLPSVGAHWLPLGSAQTASPFHCNVP
jgi:hypothetical protein